MELSITTHASDLFLYPVHSDLAATGEDGQADPDPAIMLATIHLTVPAKATRTKIEKLTVALIASETLGFTEGGFEPNEPFVDRQTIAAAAKTAIEPGNVYHWDVPFRVPHNSTPYERSPHGRVFQRVSARLTLSGLFSKALTAQKNVWFTPCPKKVDALHFSRRDVSAADGLGPIFATARSEHFTVGGYTRFALSLPDPSPHLQLKRLELALLQRTVLVSRQRPGFVEQCPLQRIKFFEAEGEELENKCGKSEDPDLAIIAESAQEAADLDGEGEATEEDGGKEHSQNGDASSHRYERSWIARLPKDHECRPSTIPGSDAHIRMSHQLEYRITYDIAGDGGRKTLQHVAAWNLILPGCALRMHSLSLPSYTPHDMSPVPQRSRDTYDGPNEHESHSQCSCGETLEELLAHEDHADESARGGTWTSREMMRDLRDAVRGLGLGGAEWQDDREEYDDDEAWDAPLGAQEQSPERGRQGEALRSPAGDRTSQSRGRSVGQRDRDRSRGESRRRDRSKAEQQYVRVDQY